MPEDLEKKKKALKKSYRKLKKKDRSKSPGGVPWTKILIVSVIIVVVLIAVAIVSWINRPKPSVTITQRDTIYAQFDGNEVNISRLNAYFHFAPKVNDIKPVITDFFPNEYTPTTSTEISHSILSDSIEFRPEIARYDEKDWDYDLNMTDRTIDTFIDIPSFEINPISIQNNTPTIINVSASVKAAVNLDNCKIRLGFKNNVIIDNNSAQITPFSDNYQNIDSGFYYELTTESLNIDQEMTLNFQLNVTLNSTGSFDILNATELNENRIMEFSIDNKLIHNYFDSGFMEANVDFTGFDEPPETTINKMLGINIEFNNLTLYPTI
ncbi:MAG: hypothetical protein EU549_01835 [Promethearchaeota archaeon]|nr:MAG: hypothetical protein EU549_01835 [Candidatus Lokiarchaeota archaeon]